MREWKETLNIKRYLTKSEKPEDILRSMQSIARELARSRVFREQYDGLLEEMKVVDDVDDANAMLGEMYDIADQNRIWLGSE